eukprot:54937-Eustigmatos_ZCMA.PRE.1
MANKSLHFKVKSVCVRNLRIEDRKADRTRSSSSSQLSYSGETIKERRGKRRPLTLSSHVSDPEMLGPHIIREHVLSFQSNPVCAMRWLEEPDGHVRDHFEGRPGGQLRDRTCEGVGYCFRDCELCGHDTDTLTGLHGEGKPVRGQQRAALR